MQCSLREDCADSFHFTVRSWLAVTDDDVIFPQAIVFFPWAAHSYQTILTPEITVMYNVMHFVKNNYQGG